MYIHVQCTYKVHVYVHLAYAVMCMYIVHAHVFSEWALTRIVHAVTCTHVLLVRETNIQHIPWWLASFLLLQCRYKSDVGGLMKACFPAGQPPACLREYLTYVHSLDYTTSPDYARAKQMFVLELSSHRYRDDGKSLDWSTSRTRAKVSKFPIYYMCTIQCVVMDYGTHCKCCRANSCTPECNPMLDMC